jgi:two-component system sensor histidine kinase VanS
MARLKSGDTELILKEFDISSVLKNIKTKYKLLFLEKGIEFNSNITDEEIPVLGDKFKLELVITNYIVNAIRYVDENKKINLNIYDKGEFVRVEVFNTSPQIKQEDIDRIWGSFYKVDKAHSREKGGTGIGLYIVKTIMELHGYEYGVQNMEDGVVFYLNIKKAG